MRAYKKRVAVMTCIIRMIAPTNALFCVISSSYVFHIREGNSKMSYHFVEDKIGRAAVD